MSVFDDFKRAWRQAVENFWEELDQDDPDGQGRAVYREVASARRHLDDLDTAIAETRQRVTHEKEQVEACHRRERLARDIGDLETARLAGEYGGRHLERAGVLQRKLDALEAERGLWRRDLQEMERALQDRRIGEARAELDDLSRHPSEGEFRGLEDSERTRSAEERLAELKRRMGRQ